jgi:hypothetical protein
MENPYICRLLIRLDRVLYRLCGVPTYWAESGHLCRAIYKNNTFSHGVEAATHFPGWMFRSAAAAQNRWPWMRKILSA